MKAMVFAAGRGTRLRPLTDTRPKALVEIEGHTLLELVLLRLRDAGVTHVIVNVHHFADQIEACLAAHDGFGLRVVLSRETNLLDTGGGLKHAAWFFDDGQPFLVHNVDVLSDIDLRAMVRAHIASRALATLAAMPRRTARPLLFDQAGLLCGRVDPISGERLLRPVRPSETQRLGFCGVHVITPELLPRLAETGAFSIIDSYLRLAAEGAPILLHRVDQCRWRDAGRLEDLHPL
jgi:NDP-sugar pyrophosphorylase family protein